MDEKLKIAEAFVENIRKRLGQQAYGIYLFGSLAKGDGVGSSPFLWEVLNITQQILSY